jgi:hypothetical protein
MTDYTLFENQASFLTMRIRAHYPNNKTGSGTGFIFRFPADENTIFGLITNKHVVVGAERIEFRFTRVGDDGNPNHAAQHSVHFNAAQYPLLAFHPNPEVDLCLIGLGPAIQAVADSGNQAYVKGFGLDQIATAENRRLMKAVENILMIGYPNGLADETHNVPIIRRGITASPVFLDHNGRPEFVIDAPCFPGSSGSPIIRYDHGCYIQAGEAKFGTRAELLGVLYAGPFLSANGTFEARHIPTQSVTADDIKIMINLGYCIRAEEILGFKPILNSWGATI